MRVNQPFIPVHLYITSEVKQYYEALFLSYRPRTECSISQLILQYKLYSFNIQDHRNMRGLLAKPLKKFPKSPIRPAGFHFCSARCGQVFNRLRAVSLFSVVRRAKRETRKWPRAWLMARDGRGSRLRPRFARLAASPLARACTPLTKPEEKERLLAV